VLDELHDYKTPGSLRHRAAARIAKTAHYRRGLTGTFTPKGYEDIYGQWKIMDPEIFGSRQDVFRERYIWSDPRFPSRVIGYRNVSELREKALSIATIKRKEDCFDVPERQDVIRKIALPPTIKEIYKKIVQQHVLETEGKLLSIDHALSRLTVLQQLVGGYLPASVQYDGENRWVHDALLDVAVDEANEIVDSGQRIVIFHRFTEEGQHLLDRFGSNAAWLHGATKPDERVRMLDAFDTPGDDWPRILIAQEAVGSVGVTMRGADYCMFYSYGFSYATHTQARDRIWKPGSTKLTYIYLQAIGTLSTWMRHLMLTKQNASEAMLQGASFQKIAFSEDEES
jgi:hypothetical protein